MKYTTAFNRGRTGTSVIHASPVPPVPVGLSRYRSVCGTLVKNVTGVPFTESTGSKICSSCTAAVHESALEGE